MRTSIIVALLLFITTGCTHQALEHSTLDVASTLRDLQYQQVLNNLAMFVDDPYTLPSQVRISAGTAQVTDQFSPTYELNMPVDKQFTHDLKLGAQRQWTENWSLIPVMEPTDVKKLRALYQAAVKGKSKNDVFNIGPPPSAPTTQPAETQSFFSFAVPEIKAEEMPQNNAWLSATFSGTKPPDNACYVGHYHDVYVWILPENRKAFDEFVMLTLIASPAKPTDRVLVGPALSPLQ